MAMTRSAWRPVGDDALWAQMTSVRHRCGLPGDPVVVGYDARYGTADRAHSASGRGRFGGAAARSGTASARSGARAHAQFGTRVGTGWDVLASGGRAITVGSIRGPRLAFAPKPPLAAVGGTTRAPVPRLPEAHRVDGPFSRGYASADAQQRRGQDESHDQRDLSDERQAAGVPAPANDSLPPGHACFQFSWAGSRGRIGTGGTPPRSMRSAI